jgi:hypothetical protein
MEKSDPNRYKLFAMILDLKNPTKILYRSPKAILEPDEIYENEEEGLDDELLYLQKQKRMVNQKRSNR